MKSQGEAFAFSRSELPETKTWDQQLFTEAWALPRVSLHQLRRVSLLSFFLIFFDFNQLSDWITQNAVTAFTEVAGEIVTQLVCWFSNLSSQRSLRLQDVFVQDCRRGIHFGVGIGSLWGFMFSCLYCPSFGSLCRPKTSSWKISQEGYFHPWESDPRSQSQGHDQCSVVHRTRVAQQWCHTEKIPTAFWTPTWIWAATSIHGISTYSVKTPIPRKTSSPAPFLASSLRRNRASYSSWTRCSIGFVD